MERLFKVTIHYMDGSRSTNNIKAKYDEEAKQKAIKLELKNAKKFGFDEVAEIDFCETILIANIDD